MNAIPLLFRKLKSAGYLLMKESHPLQAIAHHTSENLREYIVASKRGRPFTYWTAAGFPFVCLPDVPTSVNLYVHQQRYEEIELAIAKHWLQSGDTCLDLGANVGYFSALFASAVSSDGQVIAVEAASPTLKHLHRAIEILDLPQIQPQALCVTDRDGWVDFMVSHQDGADVRQSLKISPELEPLFEKKTVPSISLNTLLATHPVKHPPSLVKMDIEGAEPLALRGGSTLFQEDSLPLFMVEVYKMGLQRMGFQPKDILEFFPADRFELYGVNRSHPNPTPEFDYGALYPLHHPETHRWPWHTNVIAIPKVGQYAERRHALKRLLA